MKCVVLNVLCLGAVFSLTEGMTIHLLDVAAQQSSIDEDGNLFARIFYSKNITERITFTTVLDGTAMKPGEKNSSEEHPEKKTQINEDFDTWSLVWYIASFSGLILFFLIVSCSEWCCRNRIRRQQQQQQQQQNQTTSTTSQTDMRVIATRSQPEQQPPPSYDHFAPPSYDSLITGGTNAKKSDYEVYVVPVHTMTTMISGSLVEHDVSSAPRLTAGTEEVPPRSYAVLNMQPSADEQGNSARAPRC